MKTINILGSELRKIRKAASESLAETAAAVGIDRSHLNKIELGTYKPSPDLLNSILAHFSVEGNKASQLRLMVTEPQVERLVVGSEQERTDKMETPMPAQKPNLQVMFNPAQTPVIYTDSVFVTSNEFGLVLDVAQNLPGGKQQNIVARYGMSFDHAKKLVQVMHDHLEKNER